MLQNPTLCAGIFVVVVFGLLAIAATYDSRRSRTCDICKRTHEKPGELWTCAACGRKFCNPSKPLEVEPAVAIADSDKKGNEKDKACGEELSIQTALGPFTRCLCCKCVLGVSSRHSRYVSYIEMYHNLVDLLCRERIWKVLYVVVIAVFVGGFVTVSLATGVTLDGGQGTGQETLSSIGANALMLSVWLLVVFFVLFLIWLNRRDPKKLALQLTVRLLSFTESPAGSAHGERGLVADDLARLQSIAQLEQRGASWRSAIVVGFIFVCGTALFFSAEGYEALRTLRTLAPPTFSLPPDYPDYRVHETLYDLTFWLPVLAVFVLAMFVVLSGFNQFRRFMVSEMANRTILMACEESKHLLARLGGSSEGTLTPEQKKSLAEELEYKIDDKPPQWRMVNIPLFDDEAIDDLGGIRWYLIPQRPSWLQSLYVKFWLNEPMDERDKEELRKTSRAVVAWAGIQKKAVTTKVRSLVKRPLSSTQEIKHHEPETPITPSASAGVKPEEREKEPERLGAETEVAHEG